MKSIFFTLIAIISFGLVQGCAYIEGQKEQNKTLSTPRAHVVQQRPQRNPAGVAAKMISPVVPR